MRFVLYGGTAIALRLGHRHSIDFDFFSSESCQPMELQSRVELLEGAIIEESKPNTYTVRLGDPPVKISFFSGLTFGRVSEPETALDNGLAVASLLDLAALKMVVVQQRAEKKDYLDIAALLKAGIPLSDALGAAQALHPDTFAPLPTLKALCYFKDGDLPTLPKELQEFLCAQAAGVAKVKEMNRSSLLLHEPRLRHTETQRFSLDE